MANLTGAKAGAKLYDTPNGNVIDEVPESEWYLLETILVKATGGTTWAKVRVVSPLERSKVAWVPSESVEVVK